jgi:hypothetical protein
MSFEWNRIHKWEENIERDATDGVYQYVCEHYGVGEITELTKEQLAEVQEFQSKMNEFSPMYIGFTNLINHWDAEN